VRTLEILGHIVEKTQWRCFKGLGGDTRVAGFGASNPLIGPTSSGVLVCFLALGCSDDIRKCGDVSNCYYREKSGGTSNAATELYDLPIVNAGCGTHGP